MRIFNKCITHRWEYYTKVFRIPPMEVSFSPSYIMYRYCNDCSVSQEREYNGSYYNWIVSKDSKNKIKNLEEKNKGKEDNKKYKNFSIETKN